MSEVQSFDNSLKLCIPVGETHLSLSDLMSYNSNAVLSNDDGVFCGHCKVKTSHTSNRELGPDLFLVEIIRVTESKENRWLKNSASISFPLLLADLPGVSRQYRVVASCHHRGSLTGGHWFTKALTKHGWYELDDLKAKNLVSNPPGVKDNTVVVLLLVAEDKF